MIKSPIPPQVRQWLTTTQSIRILHLFEQSCNLVNERNELLSLVLPSLGMGPFSMVVPASVLALLRKRPSLQLINNGEGLLIGQETILIEQTAVWNPIPDWAMLRERPLPFLPLPPLPKEMQRWLERLVTAVNDGSTASVIDVTKKLAGLGEGVTPLGDDLLMGVMYGLWVRRPRSGLIGLIGETAVPHTTTLSAAFLNAAIDGEATIHWHNLANHHPNALQHILTIGHTSGPAALHAFLRTLAEVKSEK